jgi:hypothetical protein
LNQIRSIWHPEMGRWYSFPRHLFASPNFHETIGSL